jgi:two-component sensor histidine kinase
MRKIIELIAVISFTALFIYFITTSNMVGRASALGFVVILSFFILYASLNKDKNKKEEEFDSIELLIKDMSHRIKNNINYLSNMIDVRKMITENGETMEALQYIYEKTILISKLHELIYQSANLQEVSLAEYMKNIVDNTAEFYEADVDIEYSIIADGLYPKHVLNIGIIVQEIFSAFAERVKKGNFSLEIKQDNITIIEIKTSDDNFNNEFINEDSFIVSVIKSIVKQYSGDIIVNDKILILLSIGD